MGVIDDRDYANIPLCAEAEQLNFSTCIVKAHGKFNFSAVTTLRDHIENNNVDNCRSDVPAGGAIGISGASGSNLIIKNISYENDVPYNYGIFNKYFGLTGSPDPFDNIAIPPYNFS